MTLKILRLIVRNYIKYYSTEICWIFFLWLNWTYGFLGKNTTVPNTIFITSYQGYILSAWLITINIDLDHLTEIVFVRFPQYKVTPTLPFPYSALWKGVTMSSSCLKNRELGSTCLRREYLHKLFGILLCKRLASFYF